MTIEEHFEKVAAEFLALADFYEQSIPENYRIVPVTQIKEESDE